MAQRLLRSLLCLATLLFVLPAWSQEEPQETEPEQSFNLQRDAVSIADDDAEEDSDGSHTPRIEVGKVELSFAIGFLNLNQTLLQHDQIIYKYTEEATYWGDVKMVGESAFNPIVRIGYVATPWLSLEGVGSISFSDYTAEISNRGVRDNASGEIHPLEPELGEFDAENRSIVTYDFGLNAVWYFLNHGDTGKRFQPFGTGGIGRMTYDMNSNYTLGPASTWDFRAGLGIRYVADNLMSLRFEVLYHQNSVQYQPAEYFEIFNEGTKLIPLTTEPDGTPVTEFESQTINSFAWSLGVIASF